MPQIINPGLNEIQLEIDLNRNANPQDVLVSTIINGQLVSLDRFADDGTVTLNMDVDADAEVIIRAFTELGGAKDSRFEIPVDQDDCAADLNDDGFVNVDDVLIIIAAWNSPDADVTGDNMTNIDDLLEVLAAYGNCN